MPLLALIGLLIWQWRAPATGALSLLLPRPTAIWSRWLSVIASGELSSDVAITAAEIALGFAFGVGTAFALGYAVARSRTLETVAGPYIVAFQALPIVAIAPALILWLGPGLVSNSLICAFIVFFPMLVSTIVGIKGVGSDDRMLMRSFAANRWQVFRRLELPAALPTLFGGLQISMTLAVAGAVVAEAVTPLGGLGSLLYAARSQYDLPLTFVAVLTLVAFRLALYGIVTGLERIMLAGRTSTDLPDGQPLLPHGEGR